MTYVLWNLAHRGRLVQFVSEAELRHRNFELLIKPKVNQQALALIVRPKGCYVPTWMTHASTMFAS